MRRLVALLGGVLLAGSLASMSLAATPGHVLIGHEAQIFTQSSDPNVPCHMNDLWLSLLDGREKPTAPGAEPRIVQRVAIRWTIYDTCTEAEVMQFNGEVGVTDEQFDIDVQAGTAEIHDVTVPVESDGYLQWFMLDLTWAPTGTIRSETWVDPPSDYNQVFTYRESDVTGTIDNPPVAIFPGSGPWYGYVSRLAQVGTPKP